MDEFIMTIGATVIAGLILKIIDILVEMLLDVWDEQNK